MCLNPINIRTKSTKKTIQQGVWKITQPRLTPVMGRANIECGDCAQCESHKRAEWAIRMYQENLHHETGYFIMLTYSEEKVLWLNKHTGEISTKEQMQYTDFQESDIMERIVSKKDVQDFLKRLRSDQKYYAKKLGYKNTKIRYYAVSEYGTQFTKRPHYHIILWDVHPSTIERLTTQQKIWKKGIATARPLDGSIKTFYYVTKYLYKQKKLKKWTISPFNLMSTKPYIGYQFEKHAIKYLLNGQTYLERDNGVKIRIPKIYKNKLSPVAKIIYNKQTLQNFDKQWEKLEQITTAKRRKNLNITVLEKMDALNKKYEKELQTLNNLT